MPRPTAGNIVECCFPEEVSIPGPTNRPALVLQVEEATDDPQGSVAVVAHATSQDTSSVYPGEFVLLPGPKTGLSKVRTEWRTGMLELYGGRSVSSLGPTGEVHQLTDGGRARQSSGTLGTTAPILRAIGLSPGGV